MIIWIASFPKSGNTWMRSLLSDYKNFKDHYNFEDTIYSIQQFPSDFHFDYLFDEGIVKEKEKMKNAVFASQYWVPAQKRLIFMNKKDILFKTHAAPCRIGNNYFLTKETTRCAICIIRDPRQVLFSLMKHFHFQNQQQSMEFMFKNDRSLNVASNSEVENRFSHLPMPSWDIYYLSWIAYKDLFPILFIKYEDMFNIITFEKIIQFLEKNSNDESFIFDQEKVKNVFDRSNFEKLKSKEKNSGFKESKNENSGFFNEGKIDSWIDKIEPKIRETIEKKFEKLMIKYKYL